MVSRFSIFLYAFLLTTCFSSTFLYTTHRINLAGTLPPATAPATEAKGATHLSPRATARDPVGGWVATAATFPGAVFKTPACVLPCPGSVLVLVPVLVPSVASAHTNRAATRLISGLHLALQELRRPTPKSWTSLSWSGRTRKGCS